MTALMSRTDPMIQRAVRQILADIERAEHAGQQHENRRVVQCGIYALIPAQLTLIQHQKPAEQN
ncbi:hypothetical protein D3C81_2255020 [compost metagenome]